MLEYIAIAISLFFAMNIGASGAAASMGVAYGAGAVKNARYALVICAVGIFAGAVLGGGEVVGSLRGRMPRLQRQRSLQRQYLALHRPCIDHVHLWPSLVAPVTWPMLRASSAVRRAIMRTPVPRRLEEPLVLMEDAGKVVVIHLTRRWFSRLSRWGVAESPTSQPRRHRRHPTW